MPPKSTKKEEQKSLWSTCDKCGYKITQSQIKSKEECSGFGINGNSFITKSISNYLPAEFELKDAPLLYLERFLFIPEAICGYCNFTMNSNILIEVGDSQKYVKSCFAIKNDKFVDKIYSNSLGEFHKYSW